MSDDPSGPPASGRASFDLVVGADGAHSVTRSLAFGAESRFGRELLLLGVLHRAERLLSVPSP
ncbi:hypothetical protein [Sphaerisporangium flaviroseum]|uniref:hypothetical protein n=1 Tax=Sphaerisporangium flaviroseum TaxID=509199 RepID=UPI0031EB61A6